MRKAGVAVLSLFALASSALGEQFLSVSDIHFDPFADPAIVTKLEAADVTQWDAILASSTVTTFSAAGSDVNDPLLRSAIAEMRTQIAAPAFILISGDFLAHHFDSNYQQYATDKSPAAFTAFVSKTMTYVAMKLEHAFPGVRIYPTLGNNDSDCGDYAVAPNSAFLANFRDTWRAAVASRSFDRRFPTGGYYHADVAGLDRVRIIALNTNFFSTNYKNTCGKPGGPDSGEVELTWLDAELELAKQEQRRVVLLFHIPPGINVYDSVEYGGACPNMKTQTFWKDEYEQRYLKITAAHKQTIIGSFAGHTHQDEFLLASGRFIHVTPSISPVFGNNPAFEIVDMTRKGGITDYRTVNLPNVATPWTREYSFREAYKKPAYDATTLTELEGAIHNDAATRQQYFDCTTSGNAKNTASALAIWLGYWCGIGVKPADAFTACYCGGGK
jgi:sphingomyelin phosphodiesterase acid-like 3